MPHAAVPVGEAPVKQGSGEVKGLQREDPGLGARSRGSDGKSRWRKSVGGASGALSVEGTQGPRTQRRLRGVWQVHRMLACAVVLGFLSLM